MGEKKAVIIGGYERDDIAMTKATAEEVKMARLFSRGIEFVLNAMAEVEDTEMSSAFFDDPKGELAQKLKAHLEGL